jgi:hypothetical protein
MGMAVWQFISANDYQFQHLVPDRELSNFKVVFLCDSTSGNFVIYV